MPEKEFRIGTCSWKYDSWLGLVYSSATPRNYLEEYAGRYDTVEVDQWFWSLFGPDKVALPKPEVAKAYAASVPAGFRFGVKLPNSLTMSHFRQTSKTDPLVPNPHFLSMELLNRTLECLEPMRGKLGPLMFQFGYLNKQKMASQEAFLNRLGDFVGALPHGYTWGIETRNPNYLNERYFTFLREHRLAHVWLQGYYMPSIFDRYARFADQLAGEVVLRLHGPDREDIEERTGGDWSKVIEPRDADLDAVAAMLKDLGRRGRLTWAFVNNHFEGCAPRTIERILQRLAKAGQS
jgi:uncharacterized protein YecE (DUF72 family)